MARAPIILRPAEGRAYPMGRIAAVFKADGAETAERGSFILVPGGTTHDFENRSDARAGLLNVSAPGPFEDAMPAIAQWFAEHPPGRA